MKDSIATVRRRDQLFNDCHVCRKGIYRLSVDDAYLTCRGCGDRINRYMTKSEILQHQGDSSDGDDTTE